MATRTRYKTLSPVALQWKGWRATFMLLMDYLSSKNRLSCLGHYNHWKEWLKFYHLAKWKEGRKTILLAKQNAWNILCTSFWEGNTTSTLTIDNRKLYWKTVYMVAISKAEPTRATNKDVLPIEANWDIIWFWKWFHYKKSYKIYNLLICNS